MTELSKRTNCEQFSLCERIQKYFADDPAGLSIAALQMESKSLCGECPHCKAKDESPT